MTLSHPWWSEQPQVITALDITAGREFADLFGIDRGLEIEVEALEGFLERKACHRNAHLMMLVGLRVDLAGEQLIEEVRVGNLLLGRLFQTRGKFLLDLVEPQPLTVLM